MLDAVSPINQPQQRSCFEMVLALDDSLNIDTRTAYNLGRLALSRHDWHFLAQNLAEPVLSALPPLKNGRQVTKRCWNYD